MILCHQMFGNCLGKALSCFSMTVPMHKARSIQKWFVEVSVEELDWPAQSPTPSNTFGMNRNADYKLGLVAQHQCLTSLMLL